MSKKIINPLLIMLCLLLLPAGGVFAAAQPVYSFAKSSVFFGSDLYDVTNGKGIYVAAGGAGAIVRSEDGENWHVVQTGISTNLLSVAYGNGVFTAVGEQNVLLTSADGLKWSRQAIVLTKSQVPTMKEAETGDFSKQRSVTNTSVIWDGKQFVVLTQMDAFCFPSEPSKGCEAKRENSSRTGYVYVSSSKDGKSWKTVQAAQYQYQAARIKYINGAYFILTERNVLSSKNLVNWTVNDYKAEDLTYGSKGYVAAKVIYDSARPQPGAAVADSWGSKLFNAANKKLLDWTQSSAPDTVDYMNGRYVMNLNGGYLASSADGVSWTSVNIFENTGLSEEVDKGDPGLNTISQINPDRINFYKTIWDGRQYIAVTSFGGIYTSPDLVSFTKHTVQEAKSSFGFDIYGIGYQSGSYYLYGSNGRFLTSTDRVQWDSPYAFDRTFNVDSADTNPAGDFAFLLSQEDWHWRVLANTYTFTRISSEGTSKGSVFYELDNGVDVKWDGQKFTGRTRFGKVYNYDTNKENWIDVSPAKKQSIDNEPVTVSGNNRTVKYQYSEKEGTLLYYLENGKWIKAAFPAYTAYEKYYFIWVDHNSKKEDRLSSVIYGNGEFMAVGAGGLILRSADGKTWTKMKSGTSEYLTGIIWDGQQYIVVGNKGTYLTYKP
ncbi:hypothetical protein [Paenibacillus sp. MMS20-IR301]|uniref:hypothetical protein n=1 Tax=Paenibacillus sp. MMS20-IR301 TaxID=2895946 RepID=UPI0028F16E3A|nr:hypothetical protein [Paenibacillus sp. MMS20-IR301]WNS42084.1 hypothetical protein LOS79_24200 [Paenibacillus sp. MMS20-IR301]